MKSIDLSVWESASPDALPELLSMPHVDAQAVRRRLASVPNNHTILKDYLSENEYEAIVYNSAATGRTVVSLASYTSSASNRGNLLESAIDASLMPDSRIVYIGSSAKGRTSALTKKEKKHIARTGRWTDQGGDPLMYVGGLHRALQGAGLEYDAVIGNSSGGAVGTALASAAGQDMVKHVIAIDRPNFVSLGRLAFANGMLRKEMAHEKRQRKESGDPLKVSDETLDMVNNVVGEEFLESVQDQLGIQTVLTQKLFWEARGYRLGQKHGQPAVEDIKHAVNRQPSAKWSFIQPATSELAGGEKGNIGFFVLSQLVEAVPTIDAKVVEIPDATHMWKGANPTAMSAIVRRLLEI